MDFFKDKKVKQISMGNYHMGCVLEDGKAFTWGNVEYGKLGHSVELLEPELELRDYGARVSVDLNLVKEPKTVNFEGVVKKIVCKNHNSFIIDSENRVYSIGSTAKGSSGTPKSRENILKPTRLVFKNDARIIDMACGSSFAIALSTDGKVFSWGSNNFGQLGNSENYLEHEPKQIEALNNRKIIKIACGENYSLAVDDKGKVFAWGNGDLGQLGLGSKADLKLPKMLEIEEAIKDVSCGENHTSILTVKGDVYVFGEGKEGQFGREEEVESSVSNRLSPRKVEFFERNGIVIEKIANGGSHCLAFGIKL